MASPLPTESGGGGFSFWGKGLRSPRGGDARIRAGGEASSRLLGQVAIYSVHNPPNVGKAPAAKLLTKIVRCYVLGVSA